MKQQHYTESNLNFVFPAHWGIRKYDKQRFYRPMSGMGLKGVDFLLINPQAGGHLYLLEVKNFKTRITDDGRFVAQTKSVDELALVLASKYQHTIRAINAVHLYYSRKWWYPLISRYLTFLKTWQYDTLFWHHAYRLIHHRGSHTLIVWLETEHSSANYRHQLIQAIHHYFPEGISADVIHQEDFGTYGIRIMAI